MASPVLFRSIAGSALALLFLSNPGCGGGDSSPTPKRQPLTLDSPVESRGAVTPPFDASGVTWKGPGLLLTNAWGKWALAGEPRYFNAEHLYDLINGGSDVFVNYGFREIVTADYRHPEKPGVTLNAEVYDMGSLLGAFGRFSLYLDNMADPSRAGDDLPEGMQEFGILGDGDLLAWKDRYLVHLTLLDENPGASVEQIRQNADEALPAIAAQIFENVKAPAMRPPETSLFPTADILGRSWTRQWNRTLGYETLPAGFTARYQRDRALWTLFFTDEFATAAEAETAVTALKKSAASPDAGTAAPLAAMVVGRRIVGAVNGGEDPPAADIYQPSLDALKEAVAGWTPPAPAAAPETNG